MEKPMVPTILEEGPSIEIEIDEPVEVEVEEEEDFYKNLAEDIEGTVLATISSELIALIEEDINSRKEWSETYVKGLEVLGMKNEERTQPWAGACGVYSSLLSEAAIRFQSEMISETFPAQGPVKTQILGEETPENKEAADRVQEDMNFKLTDGMVEYRPEHERLLYSLGLAGAAFKKIYQDPVLGRQTAVFIQAEDLVMSYGTSTIYNCERVTHVMRKTKTEMTKLQVSGFYPDVELGDPVNVFTDIEKKKAEGQGYTLTTDERYQIYEVHVYMDLPGYEEDVPLPYVVSIERGTAKVMAVRRNWEEEDELKLKRQHFTQYTYIPGFGAYGWGLIHLIGGYARAGTSLIRQLVDAGSLANLPGGLKAKGLRIKGDDTPIAPGEFRDVDIPSGTVRDNIMPLPYKEPSQTLLALLNQITEEGRRLGAIADLNISDMSAQAPVGTTLALLERTLKTMSAIQARVHASLKIEFKLLKGLIRENAPVDYEYTPQGGDRTAKQSDYDLVEVIPVSDPNAATMAQRIMQYQAAMQLSQTAPQIYDLPELHRQMLQVLGIKNVAKLVPTSEDQTPKDPVSENMAFLNGKPTQAFITQDHDAHIQTHMAFAHDPQIAAMIGQSTLAQQMQGAMMAHIAQHVAFKYRADVEKQLGVPLTPPDVDLPPEVEVALSRVVAQAATQLANTNMQAAQQQQAMMEQQKQQAMKAQQAQQNAPMMQLEQQKLQLSAQEAQRKAQKDLQDAKLAAEKLELDKKRVALDAQREQNRLIAQKQQSDAALRSKERQNLLTQAAKDRQHNKKLKVDVVKHMVRPPESKKPASEGTK